MLRHTRLEGHSRGSRLCLHRPALRPRQLTRWCSIRASSAAAPMSVGGSGLPVPIPGTSSSSIAAETTFQRWIRWWDVGWKQNESLPPPDKLSNLLKKVADLVVPDKKLVAFACIFMVLAAACELVIPQAISRTLFSVREGHTAFEQSIRVLVASTMGYCVLAAVRGGLFSWLNQRLIRRLRTRLFERLVRKETAFFDTNDVGSLTSRLGSDCFAVARCISTNLNVAMRNLLQVIGGGVYLCMLSPQLAAVCLGASALLWLVALRYGEFQRQSQRLTQDTLAGCNSVAEEVFSLSRIVRTFGTEAHEESRYQAWLKRLYDISIRQAAAYSSFIVVGGVASNAGKVASLLVGGLLVLQGAITPEQLTTFFLYVQFVTDSSHTVCDQYAVIMEAIGAGERVLGYLDDPPAPQIAPGKVPDSFSGRLELRNVSFRYDNRPDQLALDDVNLVLQPGRLTALVGLSGSGKTTLVSLLQRHYDPTGGQVLVDGSDLREVDAAWFRSQIGVVSQEPRLFGMDVASNVAYGCPGEVSQEDVEEACRAANAHDFIMALPQGYQTPVTDKLLSGGQRQRIALARALVRKPKLLILDEATSALDAESEHLVQQALDRAMQARNRAVMVIAHRLSTVRNADATLVMDRGRIVERGTHQQLLALRGIYWSLVQRQQQGLAPEDRDLAPEEPEAPAPHSSNGGGGGGVMPSEDGLQTTVMSMMGSVEEEDASGVGVANDIVPLPMSSDSIKGAAGGRANAPAQVGLVGVDSKI